MTTIIAFVSQKGGVGKSALARALVREAANNGLKAKLADLDTQQTTSVDWHRSRLQGEIKPDVAVEAFSTAEQALQVAAHFDLLILDGPARTSRGTLAIARLADLVVHRPALRPTTCGLRCGNFTRWCRPELPKAKLIFALNRIGTEAEEAEARAYINETGYDVMEGCLERPAYRKAMMSAGRSPRPAMRGSTPRPMHLFRP